MKRILNRFFSDDALRRIKTSVWRFQANANSALSQTQQEAKLSRMYRRHIGAELNLVTPLRYTEKIQRRKLHDKDSRLSQLSDKYAVREFVRKRIGGEYLIPILGVWESAAEIDFDELPQAFVLKTNNASGTNIIVKDRNNIDKAKIVRQLNEWLEIPFGWVKFEKHYLAIAPKIIAEQYLEDSSTPGLCDYKVLCFSGEPKYIWVDRDRFGSHTRNVYDLDWHLQAWNQYNYGNSTQPMEKPEQLDRLIELATALSDGFDHVRVDFYIVGEQLYFGEMTFTNGSGFEKIYPDSMDYVLGDMWKMEEGGEG